MTEGSEARNWQGQHGRELDLGGKKRTIAARLNIMSAPSGASPSAPRVNYSNDCMHSPLTCQITFSFFPFVVRVSRPASSELLNQCGLLTK